MQNLFYSQCDQYDYLPVSILAKKFKEFKSLISNKIVLYRRHHAYRIKDPAWYISYDKRMKI